MGCDIHSFIEQKQPDGTWSRVTNVVPLDEYDREYYGKDLGSSPFDWRSYGMFGFLANVRNYSHVPTIAEPKYGIPPDSAPSIQSEYAFWGNDAHTATWLTVKQLLDFDYDQEFEDRRTVKEVTPNYINAAFVVDAGKGTVTTIRDFLGEGFFEHLEALKGIDPNPENVRVVFWFDN